MAERKRAIWQGTTVTSSANSGTVSYWAARISHRPASFDAGGWGLLDALGHRLHLPKWVMRPVCDRFDIAVGMPKEDVIRMDYNGKAPWWLR